MEEEYTGELIHLLRERVMIQRPTHRADEVGGYSVFWEDIGRIWASLVPLSSCNKGMGFCDFIMRFRYGVPIIHPMRILWGDRILETKTQPEADPEHRWVQCVARQILH